MNRFFDRQLNSLERRFGAWAIPGLIRYFSATLYAIYLLGAVIPNLGPTLVFDLEGVMAGEFWRVFTFVIATATGEVTSIGVVFGFFGMVLMFTFGNGLEQQWGVFRTNLYVYWGWFSALVGSIVIQSFIAHVPSTAGIYLAMSILFAFASYNPKFSIMLMFFIPTPIWIIAAISGAMVVGSLFTDGWILAVFTLCCLSNYLIVAGPMLTSAAKHKSTTRARQRKYKASSITESDPFNTCAVCGATELSQPETEFRVGADGSDYCIEHLPK